MWLGLLRWAGLTAVGTTQCSCFIFSSNNCTNLIVTVHLGVIQVGLKGSGITSHINTILTTTVPCYDFPIPISTWLAVNKTEVQTWSLSSEEPKCEDIIVTMTQFVYV